MSQTVSRAIEIIRFIAAKPRTLTEVTEHLEVHKSTALRLLQTLVEEGFARQEAGGRYKVGFGLISLASTSLDDLELRTVAHRHLQALVDQYGHTVHLAQLDGDEIRYIDKIEGGGPVSMGSRVGLAVDLHTAGVAKAILANLDDSTRQRLEKKITFTRFTPTTIIAPARLDEELALTRARGWAEDDGEKEDYINCVALPIFDSRGKVCGGMSVTALKAVAPLPELRRNLTAFKEVADVISRELGWQAPA
ncbi:IclR family transcriptional regulator [Cellulomonas sp. KRMCY2]|uniref:IclR family transcriptional regulator n=1 Tax=Cellulomonas sp. KRMCY2 TaxID=1304865 RepID=UPI00045E6193|nr:IclR family transcriptional regulator [Cellulomonas sp. KRMCY2]